MKVSVNDRAVDASPADGATLEGLLDGLRERGEIGSDEVVVALRVDQHAWGPEDMDRLEQTQLWDVGEVSIVTDDLRGYARRILVDAKSMLAVLQEAAERLADEFRSGMYEKANADLFNLLNALQRFLACLHLVKNTCGLGQELMGGDGQLTAQMMGALDLLQASQEREDWDSLASQLQMGLLPSFKHLEGVLQKMMDGI